MKEQQPKSWKATAKASDAAEAEDLPEAEYTRHASSADISSSGSSFVSVFRTADPVTSNLIQWAVYPVGVFSQSGNRVPAKSSDSTAQADSSYAGSPEKWQRSLYQQPLHHSVAISHKDKR